MSSLKPYDNRIYQYYEATSSLCPQCLNVVPAKIVLQDGQVHILKYCPEHGEQIELLEEDATYHLRKKHFDKPGTKMQVHTTVNRGCPYDCGICPQHDQHACIGLIEVTNACNLNCPMCYAGAGGGQGYLTLSRIEKMMDFLQESEGGSAEILQISGGEPTLHPQILEIIEMAKRKSFKYVMLNTNGVRLAEDELFAKALKSFEGGFEVYLQFDGFKDETYKSLRGDAGKLPHDSMLDMKQQALANLAKYKIPTTLVVTVTAGVNEDELGKIFHFGLNQLYVRGINFQPAAFFGRRFENSKDRVTLSGVIQRLSDQTQNMLRKTDFIPLPCNVERVAITYLYKDNKGSFIPITRDRKIEEYLGLINNTFVFTIEDALKNAGGSLNSLQGVCDCFKFLKDFRQIVPFDFFMKSSENKKTYIDENTFRISISSFVDAYNFDLKSMQKECVHIITPDLRKIPFSAYNTLYRAADWGQANAQFDE